MEEITILANNTPAQFFDPQTLPLYAIGFLTFICSLLDDFANPKKKHKSVAYYLQEMLYTVLSIALGISLCYAFETSQSVSWVVSIIMGLCGSTIIRKIRSAKDDIADKVVEKINDKIENAKKDSD